MLDVLDLFAGCGAYSLGLHSAGFNIVAASEIDPDARAVYSSHFPKVRMYGDVRQLTGELLRRSCIRPRVIVAGWPCQDLSTSGNGSGLRGERSGLWSECARLVREVRPDYVILENSPALLNGWMGEVLGDLSGLRYNAEWEVIPAAALGAPHLRERLWIIAYAARLGQPRQGGLFNALHSAPDDYREADRLVDAFQRNALPFVCRGHDGAPKRLYPARLRALGNIGSPPCLIEQIGRAILASLNERQEAA
jgi:DNA (cytosine-5)-methyltransferase 1